MPKRGASQNENMFINTSKGIRVNGPGAITKDEVVEHSDMDGEVGTETVEYCRQSSASLAVSMRSRFVSEAVRMRDRCDFVVSAVLKVHALLNICSRSN
jgi:hypothetical protein